MMNWYGNGFGWMNGGGFFVTLIQAIRFLIR